MIQQNGYGQILGMQGGPVAAAGMYENQRQNVTFARFVEQERLNLETRRLRQAEAEAASKRRLDNRRMNLAEREFDLQAIRLRHELAARQRQEERLAQDYDNRLAQQDLERQAAAQRAANEQRLKLLQIANEQRRLQNEADRMKAAGQEKEYERIVSAINSGGTMLDENGQPVPAGGAVEVTTPGGARVSLPVGGQKAAGRGSGSGDDLRDVRRQIEDDMKEYGPGGAREKEQQRILEEKREEVRRREEELAMAGKKEKADAEARLAEAQEAVRSAEADAAVGAKRDAIRAYRLAAGYDESLMGDVRYDAWESLPWTGKDAYDERQREVVLGLVADARPQSRALLQAIVRRGGEKFDAERADVYRDMDNPLAVEMIPPGIWLSAPLGEVQYDAACVVLRMGDARQLRALQLALAKSLGVKDWPPQEN